MSIDAMKTWLQTQQLDWEENAPLSDYTTFRLGGPCPLLIQATTPEQVVIVARKLQELELEYLFIGGGSNLVVSDYGLDTTVVQYASSTIPIESDGEDLIVPGGIEIDELAAYGVENGFEELAKGSGIPGTVGGAVAGNAGAFGWQIGDNVVSASICNHSGEVIELQHDDFEFAYRDSRLKQTGEILLSVRLRFAKGDLTELNAKREEILQLRREKHPNLDVDCCAGSFFRNIEPTSKAERRQAAGFFLEQVGAKQMVVGGAGLFPKHANIIVKVSPSCKAQDVYDLHKQMKAAVHEKFGFELLPEVRFLGKFEE